MDETKWFVEQSDKYNLNCWMTTYDKRGGNVDVDYKFQFRPDLDNQLLVSDESRESVWLTIDAARELKKFLNSLDEI